MKKSYLIIGAIFFLCLLSVPTVSAITDTIGSDSFHGNWCGTLFPCVASAHSVTASASGSLISIGVNFYGSQDGHFKVGIYATDGSPTGSPLATSNVVSIPATGGWEDVPITGVNIVQDTVYWIAYVSTDIDPTVYYTSGTAASYYLYPTDDLPDPWSETGPTHDTHMRMIYALPAFAPEWFDNDTSISSPAIYDPTTDYGFEVNWTDDSDANGYNYSFFEHNFTGTMANYSTTRSDNVSYYNFTGIPVGDYFIRFYANDSDDAWNATDQWGYIVEQAATTTNLLLDGTDGNKNYTQGSIATFTVIINVTGLVANLSSNYTGFETQSGVTPLINYTTLTVIGDWWNVTGYYEGNANYSASSETHYFNVTEAPIIPEFGISIALLEERRAGWWGWLWGKWEDVLRFGFIIGNLKMGGYNITDGGYVLMKNTWIPTYLFHHMDTTISVATGGLWYNVTFNESCDLRDGIDHTFNDETNDTFTILTDGVYRITYTLSFQDSAPSPSGHITTRLVKNETEIKGSLLESDTTKQNSDTLISNANVFVSLIAGDEIQLQFAADDTTISLGTHATYGDHPDAAIITIKRIA